VKVAREPGVLARRDLLQRVRAAKGRGERIVFTNGCFDLLHSGHVHSLAEARGLGDRLVVAINCDAGVRRLKGAGRPVLPARERAEIVAALECVDWVAIFRDDTPISLIRALRPDVLAKGGDWDVDAIVGADDVRARGGRVVQLREISEVRSSRLVARIRDADGVH
jgi:D-beta-D-heptose 7-phosphate kinase/D-beta-D-heptose 1-phosphate adenosyltransferase